MSAVCECSVAGWCQRHSIVKGEHFFHLCQTHEGYRRQWDDGRGPGQRVPPELIAQAAEREAARQAALAACRALWLELHTKENPTPEWFEDWLSRIPSFDCNCQQGARDAIVSECKPDFTADGYFPFTVRLHNLINHKTGKPLMSIDDARALYARSTDRMIRGCDSANIGS